MDPVSILGIVSQIPKVIGAVQKVIQSFDRIQNAPRELRDFKYSINRLERNFADFQKNAQTSTNILHSEDIEQIEDTLTLCASLFHEHEERQRKGLVNVALQSMWSNGDNEKLARYKARIDEHYSTILVPGWVQLLMQAKSVTVRSQEAIPGRNAVTNRHASPYQPAIVVPEGQLQRIAYLVDNLKGTQNTDSVDQKLRQLDEEVHKFRVQLGLQDQDDEALDAFPKSGLTDPRRPSVVVEYEEAPTTLYLNNAPAKHQKLKLERVHILAHDGETRILQYQNHDRSINVTHIIPYGSIPWTREKDSRRVSFLKAHVITVSDREGYHNYHIDPKYKFESLDACKKFQSTLRERHLCDVFDTVEITEASTIVARRQVLRLWQRRKQNELVIATMTFFTSSTEARRHRELDLAVYRATTQFYIPRFRRQSESDTVDIVPSVSTAPPGTKVVRVKFDSAEVAQIFKERFYALHPNNVVPMLVLPPQAPTNTISSGQSSASSIRVGGESAPPSLYPTSLFSETPWSTPAPTPSDTAWNQADPPSVQTTWSLLPDGDLDDWSQNIYLAHGLWKDDGDR